MFYFKKYVHHIIIEDQMIILDEVKDNFLFFSKEQTEKLTSYFETGKFDNFLKDLLSDDILASYEQSNFMMLNRSLGRKLGIDNYEWRVSKKFRKTQKRRLSLMYGSVLIFATSFLNFFGLHNTLNILRLLKRIEFDTSVEKNEIEIVANFDFFNKIIPFKNTCLEYSITNYIIFTLLGYKPKFYIGVQNYDFISHAWVEINDKVLGDVPNLQEKLHIILSI